MTRRSRRSLPHLFAIAGATGLVTLAVTVTGADPAWLAVGPLLLVILDTLAFSPVLQSRAQEAGSRIRDLVVPEPVGVGEYQRVVYAPASASHGQVPLAVAVAMISLAFIIIFRDPAWSFVTDHALLFSVTGGVLGVITVILTLAVPVARVAVRSLETLLTRDKSDRRASARERLPMPVAVGDAYLLAWLQRRLSASAERPLSLLLIEFDGSPTTLLQLFTSIGPQLLAPRTQIQYLSSRELILVGPERTIQSAVTSLRRSILAQSLNPMSVGEAVYPRDSRSPGDLIAQARSRRTALRR